MKVDRNIKTTLDIAELKEIIIDYIKAQGYELDGNINFHTHIKVDVHDKICGDPEFTKVSFNLKEKEC